eukprot:6384979-Prorocentrum_lima.AAC.1
MGCQQRGREVGQQVNHIVAAILHVHDPFARTRIPLQRRLHAAKHHGFTLLMIHRPAQGKLSRHCSKKLGSKGARCHQLEVIAMPHEEGWLARDAGGDHKEVRIRAMPLHPCQQLDILAANGAILPDHRDLHHVAGALPCLLRDPSVAVEECPLKVTAPHPVVLARVPLAQVDDRQ